MSSEIYVSTDVEADGPIPGPHSMLSFASAAYTEDKQLIATFSANLELLDGAAPHPVQEAWWKTQPEAWAACRTDLQRPDAALAAYVDWVEALPGKPVFVAMPAGFDFHVHVLVHDALCRPLPVFVVGARHQDARLRDDRPAVSQEHQTALSETLVRRASAHARRAR